MGILHGPPPSTMGPHPQPWAAAQEGLPCPHPMSRATPCTLYRLGLVSWYRTTLMSAKCVPYARSSSSIFLWSRYASVRHDGVQQHAKIKLAAVELRRYEFSFLAIT